AALSDPTIVVPGFETSRVMALIAAVLDNSTATPKKQLLRAVWTVYLFEVCNKQGEQARWYLDVKKRGRVAILKAEEKAPLKPDVTIKISDRDLVGLAIGKLQPQKLYAAKRLTVRGDLDRAYLALRVLSQEREKLDQVASAVANASPDATPARAKL
ncbi:sterol-binding-like protein, partial [Rhodotorula sp. JG-1b]